MNLSELNIRGGLTPIFDEEFTGLAEGRNSNCSIIRFGDSLLLAYRHGWEGSRIHITKVHQGFTVSDDVEVSIVHPLAVGGQEDPRLFIYRDKLWMAFTAVRQLVDGRIIARLLLARLGDDFQPELVFEPKYIWTTQWEKNWQIFAHGDYLYCIYSMNPWRANRIDVDNQEMIPVEWLDDGVKWLFGLPRGGALPVQKDNLFYCFFHGAYLDEYNASPEGVALYSMGVATFEARSPYRLTNWTSEPIYWPNVEDLYEGHRVATIYPCGAYYDGGEWIVSYGYNDKQSRIVAFDHDDIVSRLDGNL